MLIKWCSQNPKYVSNCWTNYEFHSGRTITIDIIHVSLFPGFRFFEADSFLGFSLYVSSTPDLLQATLCFKDNNFTKDTIPPVFNITCSVHGQYVIYYNERLPDVRYPRDYSSYASNNLCEVEVYGEFNLNHYNCLRFPISKCFVLRMSWEV